MSKCEQLLDSPRERENSPSRGTGEEGEDERGKKSYESRVPLLCAYTVGEAPLPLLVLSPKQRLESNLRACHVVAMAPRCTSVGALSASNEHGILI